MKIFYAYKNYNTVMFQWQNYHIVDELKYHGCSIEIISPSEYETMDEFNYEIIKKVKTGCYDLFMTCHNEGIVYINTIKEIKRLGIPTMLFCPDNLVEPYFHEKCAKHYDLVWLTSKETKYIFDNWGCKTIFLPYAANPEFLKPCLSEIEEEKIGFIGTPHGSRIDRINTLVRAGVPIVLYTKSSNFDQRIVEVSAIQYIQTFKNYMRYPIGRKLAFASIIDKLGHRSIILENEFIELKEPVPLENIGKINSHYALILSFTEANSTGVLKKPVNIVNLRNFEIPMSGGLQFTMYSEELASYFENDKEIVLAKTVEEYTEKAKFYLRSDQYKKRMTMKIAARKRAESEHTWYKRFQCAFEELGIGRDI